jgi:hypothetical protein
MSSKATEAAQKKLVELKQALNVAQEIEDRATWASDFASFRDITQSMDLMADAASMAKEQLEREIDYIEEKDGALSAFEFKWKSTKKIKTPLAFEKAYNTQSTLIDLDNYREFVG